MIEREFWQKILSDVFTISVVTLIVFFVAEIIKAGFITNYLNMNLCLLWCVFIGIIYVLIDKS